jgi:hypothetical protein
VVALFIGVAFAVTKQVVQWIEAEDGGTVKIIGDNVKLVIPPNALNEDTEISAQATFENGSECRRLVLELGPSSTTFASPAELRIKKNFLKDEYIYDIALYSEYGEEIEAEFDEDAKEIVFYIYHFSSYYYPRR